MNKFAIRSLILLGLLQSLAFVFRIDVLKGLASATVASPLALVFSNFRGLDTYALDFTLAATSAQKGRFQMCIDQSLYSKLSGPYNLRNVYGAVLSYGPKFTSKKELAILSSVLQFGFCTPGKLIDDFDLPKDISDGAIEVEAKHSSEIWIMRFKCKD